MQQGAAYSRKELLGNRLSEHTFPTQAGVRKLSPLLASGFGGHVDTTVTSGRRRRRRHSVFFKAEAVGACEQPGVSVAAVALARGLNANLLRRWVQEAERGDAPIAIRPASRATLQL